MDEMGPSSAASTEVRRTTTVRVLGPLVVEDDGREIHVAGTQRRRLLAFLASRPRRATAVDAIVDVLWPDDPPPSAAKTVQSHVVRLRQSLAPIGEPIATVAGGYRLDLDPASVDVVRFETLVGTGRRQLTEGSPASARTSLDEALALWRGTPYVDADGAAFADAERVRLDEMRLGAIEDLAEAELTAGSAATAVAELERLVTAEPGRERAWTLLMRCLYALGRQHDALVAYQRVRRVLAESFGLEPGPALRTLERQVLERDPDLMLVAQGGRLPAPLRSETTFVGREAELAWLRDGWSVARDGNGQVRLLVGPPGSGRTELAAALARSVAAAGGATVEYLRVADGFGELNAGGVGPLPGRVVDAVADRCRRGPVLLVLDDVDASATSSLPVVEALAEAAPRLSLLLVLVADPSVGGPAGAMLQRIERTVASATELVAMNESDLRAILGADGIDDDTAGLAIAVADGLPGVARREAAAWMERAASERLGIVAASSVAAASTAGAAHDSVFDEVLALVVARARRDSLLSTTWAGRKPFRALAAYGPEDADLFVGRERLVAELTARVLDRRLVAVVGASGSGKSSIVRAGLDPLVRSGRLPGGAPWRSHVMVPGTDPLGTLLAIEHIDEPGPQLLIVDQFEEIAASGVADAFAARLLNLVLDAALDVHVVLVVRADQYGTIARSRSLVELVGDAQVLVGPPTEDELRRIATQPALRTGCTVEPLLVDLLVTEVAGRDGTLPLASAALTEVWERRRDDILTADQYVQIGGLAAAVERLGERAIDDAADDEAVRDVLLRLVDVSDDGQWVRRRIDAADVPASLMGAVDALVAARLVIRDTGVLDVVHEIVFRAWPRLASWLEAARADLVIDRDLRIAARAWADEGRSDDDVYRGARLQAAVEWFDRHPDAGTHVAAFVAASSRVAAQEHEAVLARLAAEVRSRRRLSRALVAAAVLLVGSLLGATLAVLGQRSANDARRDAVASAAAAEEAAGLAATRAEEVAAQQAARQEERLVGSAGRNLAGDPRLALLLATEVSRRFGSGDVHSALAETLNQNVPENPFGLFGNPPAPVLFEGFAGEPMESTRIDVSGDGRLAAVAGRSMDDFRSVVLLLDVEARKIIRRFTIDNTISIGSIDVSDDGRYVLVEAGDQVHVIDVAAAQLTSSSFQPPRNEQGDPEIISAAFFLSSGDQYVVATYDGTMTLWDRNTDQPVALTLPDSPLDIARLTPDGRLAVARGDAHDGEVVAPGVGFWDPSTGADLGGALLELPTGATPLTFSFSGDMHYLAGAAPDELLVWDLATGQLTAGSTGAATGLNAIAFDPRQPELLAIGGSDGQLRFYDVAADRNVQPPVPALGSPIADLAFNADGTVLVGISDRGLIGVWRAGSQRTPTVHLAAPDDPAWQLVGPRSVVNDDGTFVVVDRREPGVPGLPIDPEAFGPDGPSTSEVHVTLSADGSTAIAQTFDETGPTTVVIDVDSGDSWTLPTPAWIAVLSPDGTRLITLSPSEEASATEQPTAFSLTVWDLASRSAERSADMAELGLDGPGEMTFTDDGQSVLIMSPTRIVRARLPDLEVSASAATQGRFFGPVDEVPGTDQLIVSGAGEEGGLARIDLVTGDVVATGASGESEVLVDVVVSADGSVVAARHVDSGTFEVFDARTLVSLTGPFGGVGSVSTGSAAPVISADGTMLAMPGPERELLVWDIDPDSWRTSACSMAGRNLTRDEWSEFIGPDEPYRATCPQWPAG